MDSTTDHDPLSIHDCTSCDGRSTRIPRRNQNAIRNEKDRKRRADSLLRHQQDLAEKQAQAEIDHLHGGLAGVLAGQLANFEGVAEIVRDYQKCMQPWDDNEPVDLEYGVLPGLRWAGDPRWDGDCAADGDLRGVRRAVSVWPWWRVSGGGSHQVEWEW
jgi:hypothetical protein